MPTSEARNAVGLEAARNGCGQVSARGAAAACTGQRSTAPPGMCLQRALAGTRPRLWERQARRLGHGDATTGRPDGRREGAGASAAAPGARLDQVVQERGGVLHVGVRVRAEAEERLEHLGEHLKEALPRALGLRQASRAPGGEGSRQGVNQRHASRAHRSRRAARRWRKEGKGGKRLAAPLSATRTLRNERRQP